MIFLTQIKAVKFKSIYINVYDSGLRAIPTHSLQPNSTYVNLNKQYIEHWAIENIDLRDDNGLEHNLTFLFELTILNDIFGLSSSGIKFHCSLLWSVWAAGNDS